MQMNAAQEQCICHRRDNAWRSEEKVKASNVRAINTTYRAPYLGFVELNRQEMPPDSHECESTGL